MSLVALLVTARDCELSTARVGSVGHCSAVAGAAHPPFHLGCGFNRGAFIANPKLSTSLQRQTLLAQASDQP